MITKETWNDIRRLITRTYIVTSVQNTWTQLVPANSNRVRLVIAGPMQGAWAVTDGLKIGFRIDNSVASVMEFSQQLAWGIMRIEDYGDILTQPILMNTTSANVFAVTGLDVSFDPYR